MSDFGGDTITPTDEPRLNQQLTWVYNIMYDGKWRTIWGIVQLILEDHGVRVMQTSVSARLRDLRKEKFGGHTVDRIYKGDGKFLYRLIVRRSDDDV